MISDTDNLNGTKLKTLFNNIGTALVHNGSVWKYSRELDLREPVKHLIDTIDPSENEILSAVERTKSVLIN